MTGAFRPTQSSCGYGSAGSVCEDAHRFRNVHFASILRGLKPQVDLKKWRSISRPLGLKGATTTDRMDGDLGSSDSAQRYPFLLSARQAALTRAAFFRALQLVSDFPGAGIIVRGNDGHHFHGLTTAACVWLTACIGAACGAGEG
jgi:hypothetical protein